MDAPPSNPHGTQTPSFAFPALCAVTFLALCNVSVFYNFHVYLRGVGLSGTAAGFVVGLYSLTAMVLYAAASRRIRLANAFLCMGAGILTVAACGIAYLFAGRFGTLAAVRIASGAGVFLIMASCMVALVAILPPKSSGRAFSLYSVALLAPYSIMPAVTELLPPLVGAPPRLYAATAGLLLPALVALPFLRRRVSREAEAREGGEASSAHRDTGGRNLLRGPVICLLAANGTYFTLFSALFFLFEGFGLHRGMADPGFFFTLQMLVMIALRLLGGRLFDRVSKTGLVAAAFLLTGAGFWLLRLPLPPDRILPVAVVFGLGMGLCVPPLNSLMYLVTPPPRRGFNANMMMLSVHIGTFLGPFVGAWTIDAVGYRGCWTAAALLTAAAAAGFVAARPARSVPEGAG